LLHHAASFSAYFPPWKGYEHVVLDLHHLPLSIKRLHSPMQAVASVFVLNLDTHAHVSVRKGIWDADRVHGHVFVHARPELAAAATELYSCKSTRNQKAPVSAMKLQSKFALSSLDGCYTRKTTTLSFLTMFSMNEKPPWYQTTPVPYRAHLLIKRLLATMTGAIFGCKAFLLCSCLRSHPQLLDHLAFTVPSPSPLRRSILQ
jgi:hypothetical protein